MRRLPQDQAFAEREWLADIDYPYVEGDFVGYDPAGWEDSVWVLHSVHTDLHAPGNSEPAVSGEIQQVPARKEPEMGDRVRWSEVAIRMGVELGDTIGVPPCHRWLSGFNWLDHFYPFGNGVLDDDNYVRITAAIAATSRETPAKVFGFFGWLTTYANASDTRDEISLYRGPVGQAIEWRVSDYEPNTPSNIWPKDRAWFLYTDYDLQATKVSGSRELIAALEADDYLETLRWERPPASDQRAVCYQRGCLNGHFDNKGQRC